jgi:hypothetical protein
MERIYRLKINNKDALLIRDENKQYAFLFTYTKMSKQYANLIYNIHSIPINTFTSRSLLNGMCVWDTREGVLFINDQRSVNRIKMMKPTIDDCVLSAGIISQKTILNRLAKFISKYKAPSINHIGIYK